MKPSSTADGYLRSSLGAVGLCGLAVAENICDGKFQLPIFGRIRHNVSGEVPPPANEAAAQPGGPCRFYASLAAQRDSF